LPAFLATDIVAHVCRPGGGFPLPPWGHPRGRGRTPQPHGRL